MDDKLLVKSSELADLDTAERCVSMSNALIRAAHGLSLSEKRLVAACIGKNDSVDMRAIRQKGAWVVKLTAAEYAETYNVSLDNAYKQLQGGADNLLKRHIRMERQTRKGPEIYKFVWVGGVKYHSGEGWVELHWWHEVVPHLLGLRREFTSYKLKDAAALRSIYAWRLFECLRSWESTGVWRVDIEDFHLAMDAPVSCRADFFNLQNRVINPAVRELRERGDLSVSWKPKKAGRRVVGLEFKFRRSAQLRLL